MTSQVNPSTIDGTFPIAGQDNDSQGFRDNFTNIKNNLTTIFNEITDIQSRAVVKSKLDSTALDNNMQYVKLTSPQLNAYSETFNEIDSLAGSQTIDFTNGNVQKITPNSNVALSFSNWPMAGQVGSLTLWVNIANTANTVTLPNSCTLGFPAALVGAEINADSTVTITFESIGDYFYELSTVNAGTSIFVRELGRSSATTNVAWGNVTNKPSFANVASSGSYVDLSDIPTLVTNLDSITDVKITAVSNNDTLHYDASQSIWINSKPAIDYRVTVAVNGPAAASVFNFNSIPLIDTSGVFTPITFKSGERYRFDVSGLDMGSVSPARLAFSTTPDGTHSGGIEYQTGITRVGTSGSAGATVELVASDLTPILYVYAESVNPNDVINWGRGVPFLTRSSVAGSETLQYVTPVTESTTQVLVGATAVVVNPASALTSATIVMPPGPVNGATVAIGFGGNIATLTMAGGTIRSPIASANNGTFGKWVFSSSAATWFRIG